MNFSLFSNVCRYEVLDSTNLKARELAYQGHGEGTIVIAKEQTKGRGRDGRVWYSPVGGLYLSALLYPKVPNNILELPILAGVVVAQTIREVMPKSMVVSVKWPNDCLLNWKKVAGVLCESLGEQTSGLSVVGIGVNVNIGAEALVPYQRKVFPATSLMIELGGGTVDIENVERVLISKLSNIYSIYKEGGIQPIIYLWERNCKMMGKKIELSEVGWRHETKGGKCPGSIVGTFLGLDQSCALMLCNAKGEKRLYYTGEITCYWP